LTKKYGDVGVLKGVNLKIEEGDFHALMGPNGSGKTTLTSIIASVRLPTSGRVEIYGKPPEKAKRLIVYIPQENFSSTLLTGRENLMYFAGLLGYSGSEAKKMVADILDKIELTKDADKRVSTYSGGMRKRLEQGAVYTGVGVALITSFTTGIFTTYSQLIPVLQFFSRIYPISASNSSLIYLLIGENMAGYNPLEPSQIALTTISSIILFIIGLSIYARYCWKKD